MVKGKKSSLRRPPTLLSVSEVKRLRGEIASDEAYLESRRRPVADGPHATDLHLSPGDVGRPVDEGSIRKRIERNRKALSAMDPANRKLHGREASAALKELREHEEWLKKRMLTTYDMGAYPSASDALKNARYVEACRKSMKQEIGNPEFQQRAQRAKELARLIDPEDPELCNLERLRPKRRY